MGIPPELHTHTGHPLFPPGVTWEQASLSRVPGGFHIKGDTAYPKADVGYLGTPLLPLAAGTCSQHESTTAVPPPVRTCWCVLGASPAPELAWLWAASWEALCQQPQRLPAPSPQPFSVRASPAWNNSHQPLQQPARSQSQQAPASSSNSWPGKGLVGQGRFAQSACVPRIGRRRRWTRSHTGNGCRGGCPACPASVNRG